MELYVNGSKLDVKLENEKTIGDVLRSFEAECAKTAATTVSICIDGKNISAAEFDEAAAKELKPDTKIELGVVNQVFVEEAFKSERLLCLDISEKLKSVSVKFQSGKDGEANSIIVMLADLIDGVCHTASLATLFPEKFSGVKIDGKTFSEFFAELSPILKDFEQAIASKDTVMTGDLAEYEISPRLEQLASALEF